MPTSSTTYANEPAVLAAVGRDPAQGWQVVGRSMEVKDQSVTAPDTLADGSVNPDAGTKSTQPTPTGNYVWVLSGPNGQTDTIKVHPESDPTSPNKGGVGYTVTAPPSRALNMNAPPPKEGDTRPNVNGTGYQIQEVYKNGGWVTDPTVQPIPYTPEAQSRPAEGTKRSTVDNGFQIGQVYQNGAWITDPNVKPIAWSPAAQREGQLPQKGDTRTNVSNGYQVTEVYDGANWAVDASKPPVPFTPEAQVSAAKAAATPNKGDKRLTNDNGYTVGQVYDGTAWVSDPSVTPIPVTGAAKSSEAAAANLPSQGDKRMAPDNGYLVPQVYSQGQWIPDTSPGAPAATKYLPSTPTTVQTAADQPYVATRDENNNLTWTANKNYMPADPAQRVAQLQQQARDQMSSLQAQVKGQTLSPQDAQSQFQSWWQTNIAPQQAAVQAAQQQQAFKDQTTAAATQNAQLQAATQAQTAATSYGQNAADIALRTLPYRVGAGFAPMLNQLSSNITGSATGQAPKALDMSSLVTQNPDPSSLYTQGAASALAHLSPTAAGIAGMPSPTLPAQPDIAGAFNMNAYTPPGGWGASPPPAPAAAAAAAAPAAGPQTPLQTGAPAPGPQVSGQGSQWNQYQQFTPTGMQNVASPFGIPGGPQLPWQNPYQLPPGYPG
jgi:hypothetical protein